MVGLKELAVVIRAKLSTLEVTCARLQISLELMYLPIYSRLEPFSGKCTLMGECKCALVFALRLGDNWGRIQTP